MKSTWSTRRPARGWEVDGSKAKKKVKLTHEDGILVDNEGAIDSESRIAPSDIDFTEICLTFVINGSKLHGIRDRTGVSKS
jgi:hypothetical protein